MLLFEHCIPVLSVLHSLYTILIICQVEGEEDTAVGGSVL